MAKIRSGKSPVKVEPGIFRVEKERDYVSIGNDVVENELVSWKARGILCYLLSRPKKWQVRMADLMGRSKRDGRDSVRSGILELIRAGYIHRERIVDKTTGRILSWAYAVYEKPRVPQAGIPTVGNPRYNKTKVERKRAKTEFTPLVELLEKPHKQATLPGALNLAKAEEFQRGEVWPF